MTTLSQLPAALNYSGVAGNPATFIVNFTLTNSTGGAVAWSSVTGYQVDITDQFGNVVTGAAPTITSPTANQLNLSWTAAQTTIISNAQMPRYALSIYVSNSGPYAVMSGTLMMSPPEYPTPS